MSRKILAAVEASSLKSEVPSFDIGDTVDVHTRILEGEKERVQIFNGVVIAKSGSGSREMFVVRRIVAGEGVERKFPIHSPKIAKVEVKRSGVSPRQALLPPRPHGQVDAAPREAGRHRGRRCRCEGCRQEGSPQACGRQGLMERGRVRPVA